MAMQAVKVKSNKVVDAEGKPIVCEFNYDFGDNLAHSVEKFGESVVWKLFCAKAEIEVQDKARNLMIAGKSAEEAAQAAATHILGESTAIAKDPIVLGLKALEMMDDAQRDAFIEKLQEKKRQLQMGG